MGELSKIWTLTTSDWVKGLVMAVIGAVAGLLETMVQEGRIDWAKVGATALVVSLSYLAKNFATDSNGKVLGVFGGKKV